MSMNDFEEVSFFEEEDADLITSYDPFESYSSEVLEYLPKGSIVLSDIAYPNMNCHSFVVGVLNGIKDPKNTWVNHKAALDLLKDAVNFDRTLDNISNTQPQLIIFNRVYDKYNKTFPIHSGFLIPNYGVLSAIEGVLNLSNIDSLHEHYSANFDENWGKVITNYSIKNLKEPLNLEKLYLEFGISFE
jgi:hypothetical protein